MHVEPGRVLAGKYRVERVLGRGGMGVVVAAVQEPIGRRVALKLLNAEAVRDPRAQTRFMREARAASALSGPHVVKVFDYGTLEDGSPYLVMELCEGTDLARHVKENGAMSAERAAACALDACEALAEAHARGVVHRDIKPANLFLARDRGGEVVKVLDFGIAKSNPFGDDAQPLTRSDAMVGTPQYMAPEQILSASDADARSDVWSLGAALYELVAGRPPFEADTVGRVVSKVLQDRPAKLPPTVPAKLVAVIARCLARDPNDRFRDVAALARALEPLAPASMRGRADVVSQVLRAAPSSVVDATIDVASSTRTDWGTTNRRRPRRWVGIVLLGAALGGGVVVLTRTRGTTSVSPSSDAHAVPSGAPIAESTEIPAPIVPTAPVSATIAPPLASASATTTTSTTHAPPAPPTAKPTHAAPKSSASTVASAPASVTAAPSATSTTDPNLEGL